MAQLWQCLWGAAGMECLSGAGTWLPTHIPRGNAALFLLAVACPCSHITPSPCHGARCNSSSSPFMLQGAAGVHPSCSRSSNGSHEAEVHFCLQSGEIPPVVQEGVHLVLRKIKNKEKKGNTLGEGRKSWEEQRLCKGDALICSPHAVGHRHQEEEMPFPTHC